MKRIRTDSESLASVGYDAGKRLLEVEFTSGHIYRYDKVPEPLYLDLMKASSKGAFFSKHIRDAGFAYERLH